MSHCKPTEQKEIQFLLSFYFGYVIVIFWNTKRLYFWEPSLENSLKIVAKKQYVKKFKITVWDFHIKLIIQD